VIAILVFTTAKTASRRTQAAMPRRPGFLRWMRCAVANYQSPVAVRVGQLLKLTLSTDKNGGALAGLAAIRRTMATSGIDLHDLADAVVAGLGRPLDPSSDDGWRRLARACNDRCDLLTEKERRFIAVLLGYRNHPSEKQVAWLNAIAERWSPMTKPMFEEMSPEEVSSLLNECALWNESVSDEYWVPDELFFPVNLLRDEEGIYGIRGVDDGFRGNFCDLILRPDHFLDHHHRLYPAALQMITGNGRVFSCTIEAGLRRIIHMNILRRGGHPLWSRPPDSKRDRQIYFGTRRSSLRIINQMLRRVLEVADQEAIRLARRFKFTHRYVIYYAAASSRRMLQFTAAFPALSLAINSGESDKAKEAKRLVEAGAPMKTIADLMGIPMAFRKVKPGAAELAFDVANVPDIQRLVHAYMPESLPRMKLWLRCIARVKNRGASSEFIEWVAKNASEMPGLDFVSDIMDWVNVCSPTHREQRSAEFVVRKFSPDMSLKTVTKLSADWHDAVAMNMSGPIYDFIEPWCGAGRSGKYEIIRLQIQQTFIKKGA
jgi:hypothetical protein